MVRLAASLLCLMAVAASTSAHEATRKLSQVTGTTVRVLAPASELPPGAVAGVVGGAIGGALAGERAGRGAAIAAFELAPAPEGEFRISQGIPTSVATGAAQQVGGSRGAIAGAALGAGIATQLYGGPPNPEYAPAVETAALLGAATGAAVGREAARGTVQAILRAPAQE